MMRAGIFVLLMIALMPCANAGIPHDSALDWSTMESAHFRVHYHDGEKAMAEEVLRIAERVHERLSPIFNWVPQDKTEVVLTDEYDLSNGMSTPMPSNRIYLFPTPPDDLISLEDHAGWLETLIQHEYVHTLHMDKVSGGAKWLRNIFGRHLLTFPNALQPPWFLEGLATYYETDEARGIGRGQSSLYSMMMRMEVKSGIKPLYQVNQPVVSWPMGTTRYLYGVYFYEFIAKKYGEKTITKLVENYSNNVVPFRIGSNAYQVTGKKLSHLWNDFRDDLNTRFRAEISEIEKRGVISGEAVTGSGDYHGPIVGHPDGRIFYVESRADSEASLKVRRLDGTIDTLTEVHYPARIDLHPEAGILLAQPDICSNARVNYDLYRVDPDSGDTDRLTHCARYISAAWSPDGQQIAAVHNALGRHELHLLNAEGELIGVLWRGKEGETLSLPDWSPNAEVIVASIWRPANGWDLELFDIPSRHWRRLTQSQAIEAQPRFSDDGRYILYSNDAGGVYNIRRLELKNGRSTTLSHVVGGAFYPYQKNAESPLYYAGYTGRGLDVYRINQAVAGATVPSPKGPSAIALPEAPEVPIQDSGDYSPWHSLAPTSWMPYAYVSNQQIEFGASTSGSDVLERHNYSLFAAYDFVRNWPSYALAYTYARYDPLLTLYASSMNQPVFDKNNKLQRISRQTRYDAELVYPLIRMDWMAALHFGGSFARSRDGLVAANQPRLSDKDTVAGVALSFDSAEEYSRSVSRSDGRSLLLVAEKSGFNHGDYKGRVYLGDWREYVRLSGEHVLALRAAMGWGQGTTRPFALGGSYSTFDMLGSAMQGSPFNRRDFNLRGYSRAQPGLLGRRMQLASAEYRFPIYRLERGITAPPIGLHQMFGTLFADAGAAWNSGKRPAKNYVGAGAELGGDVVLFYYIPLRVMLGYGYGFDKTIGGHHAYLRLGSAF